MRRKNVFFFERTGILILLLPSPMHCAELTGNRTDQWGSCSQLVIFLNVFLLIFFYFYCFFHNGDPLWHYYGSVLLSRTEMTIDQYHVLAPLNREQHDNMTSLDVVKMVRLNPSVALQLISEKWGSLQRAELILPSSQYQSFLKSISVCTHIYRPPCPESHHGSSRTKSNHVSVPYLNCLSVQT